MPARNHPEGEARLITAVCMLVERHIESRLPPSQRGIYAPQLDRERVRTEVRRALSGIVSKLAEEVTQATAEQTTQLSGGRTVPQSYTARLSVMDNTAPCDHCPRTTAVAVLDYQDGECMAVECEHCAPEFTSKG